MLNSEERLQETGCPNTVEPGRRIKALGKGHRYSVINKGTTGHTLLTDLCRLQHQVFGEIEAMWTWYNFIFFLI